MTDATISFTGQWRDLSGLSGGRNDKQYIHHWPYGRRWFLPHYTYSIDGAVMPDLYDDGTATLNITASDFQDLTDYRIQARALRWLYIRVGLPIGHGMWRLMNWGRTE
jgi:hypothetical protein